MNTESEAVEKRRATFWMWGIVLIGACARLITLGDQSLWMDEFATVARVRILAQDGVVALSGSDHVSPLYYFLVLGLSKLGAVGDYWLRVPSAIAGIASIPVAYLLAKRLFGSRELGLMSAAVIALSPIGIWYAQEARMYSLVILSAMLLVYFSWPAVEGRLGRTDWLKLAVATSVGLYAHHYIALVSIAIGCFLLAVRGIRDRVFWSWVASQLVSALVFVPWLVMTIVNSSPMISGVDKQHPAIWLPYTLFSFIGGFSVGPTIAELRVNQVEQILISNAAVILAIGATGIGLFWAGLRETIRQDRLAAIFCATWLFVPLLIAIAIAILSDSISYNVRYALGAYPALAIIAAAAFVAARKRSIVAIAATSTLLVITAWSLFNWYANPRYAKVDIRGAASYLEKQPTVDAVWIASSRSICPFIKYYSVPCPETTILVDPKGSNLRTVINAVPDYLADTDREILLVEYRSWTGDPHHRLRQAIEKQASIVEIKTWGPELSVFRYRANSALEASHE